MINWQPPELIEINGRRDMMEIRLKQHECDHLHALNGMAGYLRGRGFDPGKTIEFVREIKTGDILVRGEKWTKSTQKVRSTRHGKNTKAARS